MMVLNQNVEMRVYPIHLGSVLSLLGLWPVSAVTLRVDLNSTNPAPPYAAWSTAATNIQDAIDVAGIGDVVLGADGVYQAGGRPVNGFALTNRVVINKAITVASV